MASKPTSFCGKLRSSGMGSVSVATSGQETKEVVSTISNRYSLSLSNLIDGGHWFSTQAQSRIFENKRLSTQAGFETFLKAIRIPLSVLFWRSGGSDPVSNPAARSLKYHSSLPWCHEAPSDETSWIRGRGSGFNFHWLPQEKPGGKRQP